MPHEVSCVISVYKEKKKSSFPKGQESNSVWDQKSKPGPFWFSSTQSSLIWTDWGIVLIVHESEQSPAQQDEQEQKRGRCCLSSTRGHGCEPAASLPVRGAQAVTPSCILEDALGPRASYEPLHGITGSHSWSGVWQRAPSTSTFTSGAGKPNWLCLGKFWRGSPESVEVGNFQQT